MAAGGGKDVGIAGSVGVNVVVMDTKAQVGKGADLDSSDGITVSARSDIGIQNLTGGFAKGGDAGVGVAANVNVVTAFTNAAVKENSALDADKAITVESDSLVAPSTEVSLFGKDLDISIIEKILPEQDDTDPYFRAYMLLPTNIAAGGGISGKSSSGSTEGGDTGGSSFGSVGGAVVVNVLVLGSQAYIAEGVQVNADGTTDSEQTVSVTAGSTTWLSGGTIGLAVATSDQAKVAFGVGIGANVVVKDTRAWIGRGTTINAAGDFTLDARSDDTLIFAGGSLAVTKGKAGIGGAVSVYSLAAATKAYVSGGSGADETFLNVGGDMTVNAVEEISVFNLGGNISYGGNAGIGASVNFNVIVCDTTATISGSTIDVGGNLDVSARSDQVIRAVAAGGAISKDKVGVQVTVTSNTIVSHTVASIDGSTVTVDGDISIVADATSWIESLAFTVAGGGKAAVGAAGAVNVVVGRVGTYINDSTVEATGDYVDPETGDTEGNISMESVAGSSIRSLSVGVSGSGKVGVTGNFTPNVIVLGVDSLISGNSNITADGSITLEAVERAPLFPPGDLFDLIPESVSNAIQGAVDDSPLDLNFNIMNLAVTVSGAGNVAAGATFSVNNIVKSVRSEIEDSTVTATNGDIILDADSESRIAAFTAGVAASGKFSLDATGILNNIISRTEAEIANSTIDAGGFISLDASDTSAASALVFNVAASGKAGVGINGAVNIIVSKVGAQIADSNVNSVGSGTYTPYDDADNALTPIENVGVRLNAESKSNILSFAGGVAAGGNGSALLSITSNNIVKDIDASIINSSLPAVGGDVLITAKDSSIIDSLSFGVSASGKGAGGMAMAANVVTNRTRAAIIKSTVVTNSGVDLDAISSPGIHTLAVGVAASGQAAVQVMVTGNVIANSVDAIIDSSDVTAVSGGISLHASDTAPGIAWLLPEKLQTKIDDAFDSAQIDLSANIFAVMVSVAGSGNTAVNVAAMGNVIANSVQARIIGEHVAEVDTSDEGVINAENDTITIQNHGFTNGQFINYSSGDNDNIEGLADGQYQVVWVDASTFKLKTLGGDDVDIQLVAPEGTHSFVLPDDLKTFNPTAPGPVDYDIDSITLINHGFSDGDIITYSANGNDVIGGLVNGSSYEVVVLDADNFKLNDLSGNLVDLVLEASSGTHSISYKSTTLSFVPSDEDTDFDLDTIALSGHGFTGGEIITYSSNGNDAVGGLVDGGQYEVVVLDEDSIGLKSIVTSTIDIQKDSEGNVHSGTHGLDYTGDTLTVDTASGVIDYTGNTITITDHGCSGGETFTYKDNGSDSIGGLVNGEQYEVVFVDANTISLKDSGGAAVDLEAPETDAENHQIVFDGEIKDLTPATAIDYDTDIITINDHHLLDGSIVTYRADGNDPITGLDEGVQYEVVVIDKDRIKLRRLGEGIDLRTAPPGGTHSFALGTDTQTITPSAIGPLDYVNDTVTIVDHGFIDGETVIYYADGSTTMDDSVVNVGGLEEGHEYTIEYIDADHFKLVDGGDVVDLTDTGAWGTHAFVKKQDPVNFTPSIGDVDYDNYIFTVTDHGFEDGQIILYKANYNEIIGGLAENIEYQVELIDADHFRLINPLSITEMSLEPASSESIDPDADTITIIDHGFTGSEIVTYSAGDNTAVTGLVEGAEYQVVVVDEDHISLWSIADSETADLELTATGGSHTLTWSIPSVIESIESVASQKDDTVQALTINITGHEFDGGEIITYDANGNGVITGLVDGRDYEVVALYETDSDGNYLLDSSGNKILDSDRFQLKVASTGELVTYQASAITGTHSFKYWTSEKSFVPNPVDYENDIISISSHGYLDGTLVTYHSDGNIEIGGLTDGAQYTIEVIDADNFRLSDGSDNTVNLESGSTEGTHRFVYEGDIVDVELAPVSGSHSFSDAVPGIYEVNAGTNIDLSAESKARIKALVVGVAGSGTTAINVNVTGNVISNTVNTSIEGPDNITVISGNDLTLTAVDSSIIDAISVGVSAGGTTGGGAALAGNVIANRVSSIISGSTIESTAGNISIDASQEAAIRTVAVGVAAGGTTAVQFTAMGNVIANTVASEIKDSGVTAGGNVTLSATDFAPDNDPIKLPNDPDNDQELVDYFDLQIDGNILALMVSVAGSGTTAGNAALMANVISNNIGARIINSDVDAGGDIEIEALSEAGILALMVGVAGSGTAAGNVNISGNTITNTIEAIIKDNNGANNVHADGSITIQGKDSSSVDSLSVGVAASGTASAGAMAAGNVVANNVGAKIDNSVVDAGSSIGLNAVSSAVIRTLSVGVSASGGGAGQFSGMGNVVANTTAAEISNGSVVTAGNDVNLIASDIAPSLIPDWALPSGIGDAVQDALDFLSVDLDGNILALMVSVAGSGTVAVNAALIGNVIANNTGARIIGSTVTSGTLNGAAVYSDFNADSDVDFGADTININGHGFVDGQVITYDTNGDRALFGLTNGESYAVEVVDADNFMLRNVSTGEKINLIDNLIDPPTGNHTFIDNADTLLWADSKARIISAIVGVAGSGGGAANAIIAGNVISNNVEALIVGEEGGTGSDITTSQGVRLTATDSSVIDSLAVGVAGTGGVAGGAALAGNVISNNVKSIINDSSVYGDGDVSLNSTQSAVIRALAVGVAASGGGAGQFSAMGNVISNRVASEITGGSIVYAGGDVSLFASDIAPDNIPMQLLPDGLSEPTDMLNSLVPDIEGNILALMVSVAGTGGVAANAAAMTNVISNNVGSRIDASEVKAGVNDTGVDINSGGSISGEALSRSGIMALMVGVAGSGAVALNANISANVISNTTEAVIDNAGGSSDVFADGSITLTANDLSSVDALGVGVAGTGGAAGGVMLSGNVIANRTRTLIDGSIVDSDGSIELDTESSSVIRTLNVGVAGSGGGAAQLSVMGNVISNTVTSEIIGSTATAAGDISLSASDTAPDSNPITLPEGLSEGTDEILNHLDVDIEGNILALMVSVAGTGGVAANAVAMVNVIENDVGARITHSTVKAGVDNAGNTTLSDGDIILSSHSSARIMALEVGVAGSGAVALNLNIASNTISNTVESLISTESNISAGGDLTLTAEDSSTVDALSVGVAGTGGAAGGAMVAANVIANTIRTAIDGTIVSDVTNVTLDTDSASLIRTLAVGVAASGGGAGQFSGMGNVIANTVEAEINGSEITADGFVAITASEDAPSLLSGLPLPNGMMDDVNTILNDANIDWSMNVLALMVSVGGSGGVAANAAMMGNVITNKVRSKVSGSKVKTGTGDFDTYDDNGDPVTILDAGLYVEATTVSKIMALLVGVAGSGGAAVNLNIAGNVITNTIEASVTDNDDNSPAGNSVIDAEGDVTLKAKDSSTIDGLSFGVAASGGAAAGAAMSANVITNTINAAVKDSTLETDGDLDISAESSSVIRTLGVGVSGSGGGAFQFTAMGNTIANSVESVIDDSMVSAGGNISLSASDEAPAGLLPEYLVPEPWAEAISDALEDSPISPDGNIFALMVSVAGSGGMAMNAAVMGNAIANSVNSQIIGSTVLSGTAHAVGYDDSDGLDASDYTIVPGTGDIFLTSLSSARIVSMTVGVAASGGPVIDATTFGAVISNRVDASITDGSVVESGGKIDLDANDDSEISSFGLSIAGSGAGAGSFVVAVNVITNLITAQIAGATVTSGTTLSMDAISEANVLSFAGGVAATGVTGASVSMVSNTITNTVKASIGEKSTMNLVENEDGVMEPEVVVNTEEAAIVKSGSSVKLTAKDESVIDSIGFGVAASGGGGALGLAIAANVIANTIDAEIMSSTVFAGMNDDKDVINSTANIELHSSSSSIIRTLALGVSATSDVAVQMTVLGNAVANKVTSGIDDSTVLAGGNVSLTASDKAPSSIPAWLIPADKTDDLDSALADSPISLNTNILSLNVSVAGSGAVAVNGAFTGNVIANQVLTSIDDSTVKAGVNDDGSITNAAADVLMDTDSSAGIISATVGVGASGGVAIDAVGYGNVITNKVASRITGNTTEVTTGDMLSMSAEDKSVIRSLGLSIAASGGVAASIIAGTNVIGNLVTSQIAGATIDAGGNVTLEALSNADIMGFAGGVAASGATAVQMSAAVNVVTNTVKTSIGNYETNLVVTENEDGSTSVSFSDEDIYAAADVDSDGSIAMTAKDESTIDSLGFGVSVAGGSGAAGMAIAANMISNTITSTIGDAAVDAVDNIELISESSSRIRMLSLGVSASGDFAAQFSVIGNLVTNTVKSEISGSTVTAGGSVSLSASDTAPSVIDLDWLVGSNQSKIDNATQDSPLTNLKSNILALVLNFAGSGTAAAGVTVMGNKIENSVDSVVTSSTVRAGVDKDLAWNNPAYQVSDASNISLTADSSARIIAMTAGMAASGLAAVDALVSGNQIENTVGAKILNSSTAHAGGAVSLIARDESNISAVGLSFAASGGIAGAILYTKNDIGSVITTQVKDSTVLSGKDISLNALSNSSIVSFVGGVAMSGVASGVLSMATNSIGNTVTALVDSSTVNAGVLDAGATGKVEVKAADSSTIDAIAVGLSASGIAGAGAAVSNNYIGFDEIRNSDGDVTGYSDRNHSVTALIDNSTVDADSNIDVMANASATIRSLAAGLAGGGLAGGQASVTLNKIGSKITAEISGSTATAGDTVNINASDDLPAADFDDMLLPDNVSNSKALNDSEYDRNANIISFAGSIAVAGGVAGSAAVSDNVISNKITASIDNSTVTATAGDVLVNTDSNAKIVAVSAGIGAAAGAALNASASVNIIDSEIKSNIINGSTIDAGDDVSITASDSSIINAFSLSLSGAIGAALGGAVVTNTIGTDTAAYITGNSSNSTGINSADEILVEAYSNQKATGKTLGATIGIVSGGAAIANGKINGSTIAYMDNYVEIGKEAGMSVDNLNIKALSDSSVSSEATAIAAGIGAGTGNSVTATIDPTISAYIGSNVDAELTGSGGILAQSRVKASAVTNGITLSLTGSVGASIAKTIISPTVSAFVAGGSTIQSADSVSSPYNFEIKAIRTTLSGDSATAAAKGSAGGLLFGAVGTRSDAVDDSKVTAYIGDENGLSTSIDMSGTIKVYADQNAKQTATASGKSGGIVAAGSNKAFVTSSTITEAYIGSNVSISGGGLEIHAVGTDNNLASVVAGSGGVVAGTASEARTTNNSNTKVTLGKNSDTAVNVDNELDILAQHTAGFTSKTNSTTAAVVGASGSKVVNTVNSNVDVIFGQGLTVSAGSMDVDVNNIVNKNNDGSYDVVAGSGGLAGGPAASSSTVINDRTNINVGDGVSINTDGNLSISSNNQVNATDKVKLDSGGAIALAKAKSSIVNNTNTNTIYIGDADLDGGGDVVISNRSGANISSLANAKTYGAAGAAQGESYASVHADNDLILGDGASIMAGGDVSLISGVGNNISVTARTDLWNKTALPIKTDPKAHGEAVQSNLIDIRDGAEVLADSDVYITAKKGYTSASGVGQGTDLYREVLAAIANFFGSIFGAKPVSLKINTSSQYQDAGADVTIDGYVRSGAHNVQWISIANTDSAYIPVEFSGDGAVLDFSTDGGSSIIRNDGGSWIDDGFAENQYIAVDGSTHNDRVYKVSSVTDDELVLEDNLAQADFNETARVFSIGEYTALEAIRLETSSMLDIDRDAGTITRDDGRDWTLDGFAAGMYIRVIGSSNNDDTYLITSVAGDAINVLGLKQDEENISADIVAQDISINNSYAQMAASSTQDLNFVGKRTSLVRTDGGDWLADGFISTGNSIAVGGNTYNVVSISATEIILEETYGIAETSQSDVDVTSEIDNTSANLAFSAQVAHVLPEIDVAGAAWTNQGFESADRIVISGADNAANNGTYTINSIDGSVISLNTGTVLADATDSNATAVVEKDISVSAGVTLTFDATQETISRDDGNWDATVYKAGQSMEFINLGGVNTGTYTIASVSGNTIYLTGGSGLADHTDNDGSNILLSVTITNDIVFVDEIDAANATIENLDGNWSTDYQAGHTLAISGADESDNDGDYTIVSISGDTMEVSKTSGQVVDDAADGGLLTGITVTATVNADFDYVTNNAYIERSEGSWLVDDAGTAVNEAFTVGQTIIVSNSENIGPGNNDGEYVISAITGTTITLSSGDELITNTETNTDTAISTNVANVIEVADGRTLTFTRAAGSDTLDTIDINNTDQPEDTWEGMGYVQGDYLQVIGSTSSDGLYRIDYVAGTRIFLSLGGDRLSQDEAGFVVDSSNGAMAIKVMAAAVEKTVSLTDGTVLDFDASLNTITRTTGSWAADGFTVGQYIVVGGNVNENNIGTYRIDSIDQVLVGETVHDIITLNEYTLDENDDDNGLGQTENNVSDAKIYAAVITSGDLSSLVTHSDGVSDVVFVEEDLAANINKEIEALNLQMQDHATSEQSKVVIQAQIDQLNYQLEQLGMENGSYPVTVIEIPEISVQSGDIIITGDSLSGSGELDSPGDASISIDNHSPFYLRINKDLTVGEAGGNILFNGARVYDNQSIQQRNSTGFAQFSNITTSVNSAEPMIEIRNTYNPPLTGPTKDAPAPDIIIEGASILNANGTVSVYNKEGSIFVKDLKDSEGNVISRSTIQAKTIEIKAGGDFVVATDIYHVGADPEATYASQVTANEASNPASATSALVTNTSGATIAGNNVFLTARLLNINGIVQSGIENHELTLEEDMAVEGGGTLASRIGDGSSDVGWMTLLDDSGDPLSIEVQYDADTGRLIIDEVATRGGLIKITGHIISTETDGNLRVMDGFGDISITNNTGWDIQVANLNTGEDKEIVVSGSDKRMTGKERLVTYEDDITFYNDSDGDLDAIKRRTGSWLKEGFTAGQEILVTGAEDPANNGRYIVDQVNDEIMTLTQTVNDLTGVFDNSDTLEINGSWFDISGDTVTRNLGSGTWGDDGFAAGETIRIQDSSDESNYEDYTITGISSDGLTLTLDRNITVTGTDLEVIGNWISFNDNAGEVDEHDTVTRSTGSWIDEGYRSGMTIIVNNSGSNDGEYKIFAVTDSELILESTAELVDEADNTDEALQLRGLGNGIEGTVIITDTAYNLCTTTDADGNPVDYIPLVTTYTHIGNAVQVSNNDYDNIFGATSSVDGGNDRLASYQPLIDQRYYWITGEKAMQMSVTEWTTTSWLGINLSSSVSSHTSYVLPPTAVDLGQEANYADVPDGLNYNGYQYEYDEITTSNLDIWQRWTTTHGWWIFSTTDYHLRHINLTGTTNYNRHSVSADNTIGIQFLGSDSGTVTIISDTDIYLDGNISNTNGVTTITSAGSIYQNSSSGVIRSEDIILTAGGAIGSYNTSPATITRSTGDWTSEGYSEGDVIRFTEGFGSNNDKDFTILSVDESTITLNYGSGLVASTDSEGFTVYNVTDDTTTEYSSDPPILTAIAELTEVASVRTDLYGGKLDATAQGLVAIDEIDEKLTIGDVESIDGDVIISSDGGIYSSDAGSLIQGDNIELIAATGGLGTADLGLKVNTNNDNDYDDDDKPDALTAQAFGDIFISEISGDLRLVSVESLGGDIDIIAGDGSLIDANDIEYQDVRTVDELADLWDDMNLLDDDGSETQTAYKDLKTNEYQTYWNYRAGESKVFNSQSNVDGTSEEIYFDTEHGFSTGDALIYRVIDGTGITGSIADEATYYAIVVDSTTIRLAASRSNAVSGAAMDIGAAGSESYVSLTHMIDYDENYQIAFSSEEREAYKTQLDWDDERIDLEETKRTEEFHDLHSRYGVIGDVYNPGWQYEEGYTGYVSDFEAAAAVNSENDTISIGTHLLSTGTAVLYSANGGDAIGNLTDGELYFVIVIDSSTVQLAETSEDALNNIYIDIDGSVATGTEHILSDVDALTVGAQWTEDQLLYSLGAGWLKEATDTEAQIEAANITANNIKIDVSGSVGEHGVEQKILIHEKRRHGNCWKLYCRGNPGRY